MSFCQIFGVFHFLSMKSDVTLPDRSPYFCIEKNGIELDIDVLKQNHEIKYPKFSIKDNKIYTQYNLYNFTSRPSNAFNGINFAALNKKDNTREALISKDGMLFEYDMKAYHLFISAKLIGYKFIEKDIHLEMGRMYFNKEELTEEDYKLSKQLSFKMMNGGVYKQYEHVPFWKQLSVYVEKLWGDAIDNEYIELYGGRRIQISEISNPTPQKLYNYIIQSAETYFNIQYLKELLKFLEGRKTFPILYVYDSILLNYNIEDDKQILKDIKKIVESTGFKSNVSYGKNYKQLKKLI